MAYKPQAETSKIKFTSRAAIKAGDNFFTVEATEERNVFPDMENLKMEEEWKALCDSVNGIIDTQVDEIMEVFKKK